MKGKTQQKGSKALKNPKHELFCWLWAGYHNSDLFANGTRCYMQVYNRTELEELEKQKIVLLDDNKNYKNRTELSAVQARVKQIEKTARTNAADLLANAGIRARTDYLIDQYITNDNTDRELQFTIMQRYDLKSKVAAIKEFNSVRGRNRGESRLEGELNISWEQEDDSPKPKKSTVKATISVKKPDESVEWEDE